MLEAILKVVPGGRAEPAALQVVPPMVELAQGEEPIAAAAPLLPAEVWLAVSVQVQVQEREQPAAAFAQSVACPQAAAGQQVEVEALVVPVRVRQGKRVRPVPGKMRPEQLAA